VALAELRSGTTANLKRLPEKYKALRYAPAYPVEHSAGLERLLDEVRDRHRRAPQVSRAR
jgi:hypothetical protein